MDDWRIEQGGEAVRGKAFRFQRYAAPRADWDHDHCELCHAKLMEGGPADSFAAGYATGEPSDLRWVCEECWSNLRDTLAMRLEPS